MEKARENARRAADVPSFVSVPGPRRTAAARLVGGLSERSDGITGGPVWVRPENKERCPAAFSILALCL
jgi:hypothetical protein